MEWHCSTYLCNQSNQMVTQCTFFFHKPKLRFSSHGKNLCACYRWFAKHFLHPDIVAEYKHIFLWDEDIGVENFHPGRLFHHLHLFMIKCLICKIRCKTLMTKYWCSSNESITVKFQLFCSVHKLYHLIQPP